MYKNTIANLKDSLIDIPPEVYKKDWKVRESNIGKLDYYLANNDCTKQEDVLGCYRETRLLLITTTKELDASNDHINLLNKTVDRMTGNIASVIDNLDDKKADDISLKDKAVNSVKPLLNKK